MELTKIDSLIHSNFEMVDADVSEQQIRETICQSNHDTHYFTIHRNEVSMYTFQQTTNKVICLPIPVLDVGSSLRDLAHAAEKSSIIFIMDQRNALGFVTKNTVIHALLQENDKLTAFMDTILKTCEDSYTAIDKDANVIQWSKGAETLFSIKEEAILGKPITDFFTREHLEILNTLQTGSSVYGRQHHAREDLVVLINSNPVIYQDEIIGAVVSEKDITSQIRLNNELYKTAERLFDLEEVVRKSSNANNPFTQIRGSSRAIQKTIQITEKAAKTDAAVLIYGESGVGKELFAKAIHHLREDEDAPYIAINCGAISSSLFESEIFGYEKGAFSGADSKGKKGKAELARGGTLFLDEIGEMPLEMQVKFLRLLQEKCFYPVGGTKEIQVDFRIIAATNRNVKELIQEGKFREDLYYRLNVVNFTIPALRERTQDIIELTHYFLYEMSVKYNRPIHGISQQVMQSLLHHPWPGNIRELKNAVERMVVFSDNGEIKHEDLPNELTHETTSHSSENITKHVNSSVPLQEQLQHVEREIIIREIKKADGNKAKCAQNLGVTRATLYNRIHKLNIQLT